MLWKAADQRESPAETRDITTFGCEVTKGRAVKEVAAANFCDVISCSCSVLEGKLRNCSCMMLLQV